MWLVTVSWLFDAYHTLIRRDMKHCAHTHILAPGDVLGVYVCEGREK